VSVLTEPLSTDSGLGESLLREAEAEVPPLAAVWLGRRRYAEAWAVQQQLFEARRAGRIGDTVLLLEHFPVITLGRGAKPEHVLHSRQVLAARGIDVEVCDRGGEVTVHAPGQLVAYPIVQLLGARRDVRRYVNDLRETMADLVRPLGIHGGAVPDLVGLWVDLKQPAQWTARQPGQALPVEGGTLAKIGAIGVRLSRWVTLHGFALNLENDLSLFRLVIPCGVTEFGVTSVAALVPHAPSPAALWPRAADALAARLGRRVASLVDASEVADLPSWFEARFQPALTPSPLQPGAS
jgi:lipoyl(octanoyl) transferase